MANNRLSHPTHIESPMCLNVHISRVSGRACAWEHNALHVLRLWYRDTPITHTTPTASVVGVSGNSSGVSHGNHKKVEQCHLFFQYPVGDGLLLQSRFQEERLLLWFSRHFHIEFLFVSGVSLAQCFVLNEKASAA